MGQNLRCLGFLIVSLDGLVWCVCFNKWFWNLLDGGFETF